MPLIQRHNAINEVPVGFILEFAERVERIGELAYAAPRDARDEADQKILEVGGILFCVENFEQSKKFRNGTAVRVSAKEWSCTLELLNILMGGKDTFEYWNRSYIVIDYAIEDRTAWLRDMTVARMMTDEWRA